MDPTHGYAHRIDMRAPAERVWRALIEPKQLVTWYAQQARVEAKAGGQFWVHTQAGLERDAHIDVFEPLHRLRLIYQPPRDRPTDESVVVDDFLLQEEPPSRFGPSPTVSVLRLLGSGYAARPDATQYYLRVRSGWDKALARLKVLVQQGTGAPVKKA